MDDNKVAILLEDLQVQFRTFGEGMQLLNDKVDRVGQKLDTHIEEDRCDFEVNRREHQQLMMKKKTSL